MREELISSLLRGIWTTFDSWRRRKKTNEKRRLVKNNPCCFDVVKKGKKSARGGREGMKRGRYKGVVWRGVDKLLQPGDPSMPTKHGPVFLERHDNTE
jgi:hypothetical protein